MPGARDRRIAAGLAVAVQRIPPLIEALEAEDISSVEVLAEELRKGNQRARRLAARYGFTECAPDRPLGG